MEIEDTDELHYISVYMSQEHGSCIKTAMYFYY
jgi:hypothetical protein